MDFDNCDLTLTVVYGHISYPGKWVMHCFQLGLDAELLKAETAEFAKNEALDLVKARVYGWAKDLGLNIS